jgi:hypothetical protein
MNSVPDMPKAKIWLWLKRSSIWILRGILLLFLLAILLALLDYGYEDWSGTRAWHKAKAEIEAAGISLDPGTYISPPVPDKLNFAALPIFQLSPDHNEFHELSALNKAVAPIVDNWFGDPKGDKPSGLSYLWHLRRGEKVDISAIQNQLHEFYLSNHFPVKLPPGANSTEIVELICPALADLRKENASHPSCRFNLDYASYSIDSLEPVTSQLELAQVLSCEEELSVLDNNPQLALDDFKVDWKLVEGLQRVPLVVGGLVTQGVVGNHLRVIGDGLIHHVWNDSQLKELDSGLKNIDALANGELCLRGDLAVYSIPLATRWKTDPSSMELEVEKAFADSGQPMDWKSRFLMKLNQLLTPSGAYDQNLANHAQLLLPGNGQMLDLSARRVFPQRELNSVNGRTTTSAQRSASVLHFAHAQVTLDEARIAIRLEHFRLSHGAYPVALDRLDGHEQLPHDVMNGDSYRYKLQADGTYLLYSVGWNEVDDGGKILYSDGNRSVDEALGDWVWMAPKK